MGGAKTSPCTGTTAATPSRVSLQHAVNDAIAVTSNESCWGQTVLSAAYLAVAGNLQSEGWQPQELCQHQCQT